MKKNIIIFCLINGLSISSISSGTVIKSAIYGDSDYTKYHRTTQRTPEWCYYATMEMLFPYRLQYDFAEDYFDFTHNFSGQVPPCRSNPYACGGVKGEHIVSFWNYCTRESKHHATLIEAVFNVNGSSTLYTLPCIGFLSYSPTGYAHAVFLFYVTVTVEEVNGTYYVIHRASYIDPLNGLPSTRETRSTDPASVKMFILR